MPEARPATTKKLIGLADCCHKGSTGPTLTPVVAAVQLNLRRLGYDLGDEDKTPHIFGDKTEAAVKHLQEISGIPVNGIVCDNLTWKALFKPIEEAAPTPVPTPVTAPTLLPTPMPIIDWLWPTPPRVPVPEKEMPEAVPEAKPLIPKGWTIPLAVGSLLLMSRRKSERKL